MSGRPEYAAASPSHAAGVDPDYPQLLRALEARRRSADQALLDRMVDLPDPHPPSRGAGR